MKPGGGRAKGARGEREVVAIAKAAGFANAHRTAPMQAGHSDKGYPDVDGIPLITVECKSYSRTPVNGFAKQYLDVDNGPIGKVPVLAWKDNGTPWRATLPLSAFLGLMRLACYNLKSAVPAANEPMEPTWEPEGLEDEDGKAR